MYYIAKHTWHLHIYNDFIYRQWRDTCMVFLENWKQKSASREMWKLHELQIINACYETPPESQIPSITSDQWELEGRPLISKFLTITSLVLRTEDIEAQMVFKHICWMNGLNKKVKVD